MNNSFHYNYSLHQPSTYSDDMMTKSWFTFISPLVTYDKHYTVSQQEAKLSLG